MLSRVLSYALCGIDGLRVEAETDIANGMVRTDIVGMGDTAVKEARDRIYSAIENSGYTYPRARVVVSLAPADIKKEGSGFDLAMALGILCAAGVIKSSDLAGYAVLGELALDGGVRGVAGILPVMIAAEADGIEKFIIPSINAAEAAYAAGLEVYAVGSLTEAVEFLTGQTPLNRVAPREYSAARTGSPKHDFKYVRGQNSAKRAIEIAVSGGHNIMMIGAPGSGKTMLARCIPSIMPPLTYAEALEVTKIHSVAGILDRDVGVVTERPFRSPHHTATTVALTGGGKNSKPGEISLAHNGVLFLDEMPEYSRHTLETLRQPLEDGVITVARANLTVTYPAEFMLVASMNPCPCGNYGSKTAACKCTRAEIDRYMAKLSAPLLDRIDMHIAVDNVAYDDLRQDGDAEPSERIRERVSDVRAVQQRRFAGTGIKCNDGMGSAEIAEFCRLDEESEKLLETAFKRFSLSARAYTRILKVARTIADMAGRGNIARQDVAEAIGFRTLDRKAR